MSLEIQERETILRHDPMTGEWTAWTDDPNMMALWKERGFPVKVFGAARGKPRSWHVRGIPSDRVVLLKMPRKSVASTGTFSGGK